MSIKCMNWAWGLELPPTTKLVLMSLADNANDNAKCFPSVKYIAQRCCISKRSVQRTIKILQQNQLIDVHYQKRKNGSHQSNLYVLNIPNLPSDILTPPGSQKTTQIVKQCHETPTPVSSKHDKCVTPLTTIESSKKPTTTNNDIEWPKKIHPAYQKSILALAKDADSTVIQVLVDELAGQIDNVKNPVGYFRALLLSHQYDDFLPSKAIGVQSSRKARKLNELAIKRAHQLGDERVNQMINEHQKKCDG